MRKTFVFTLLLALLSIGSIGYVASDIYPLRDQVAVREVAGTFRGDVSATEGLVASLKADYYKAMNWHTKVYLGNPLPRTDSDYTLTFPVQETTNYLRERNDIDIRITVEDVMELSAFAYLAEGLELGEKRKETIFLKDHAEFYNIEVEVLFPEVTYAWRPSDIAKDTETEAALRKLFDENFRFPIGEHVSVEGHGDVTSHGPGYGYGINTSSETFGLDVKQVFLGNSAYFTFNRKGEKYSDLDVSRIPLGYGIYCLTVPEDSTQPTLINVYTLDPNAKILKLTSDDLGNVLAYTVENGIFAVTVIDSKTNTLQQRLELADFPGDSSFWATYEADQAIAVALWNDPEKCRLVLLTMGKDALYKLHWNLTIPSSDSPLLTYSDASYNDYVYSYAPVMAWNGQYLAFGLSDDHWSNFTISLYDENGLVYYGLYQTSLNIWPIRPDDDVPLTLEWE